MLKMWVENTYNIEIECRIVCIILFCLKMCMCSLKLLQMCFGMAYVGSRGNFNFDFFFFFFSLSSKIMGDCMWLLPLALPLSLTSNMMFWLTTSSSLWDTCQYAVCAVVMSRPLVILSLCLMLWLQWIPRNFSELFLEAGNMILFIILTTDSMWYLWMTQ